MPAFNTPGRRPSPQHQTTEIESFDARRLNDASPYGDENRSYYGDIVHAGPVPAPTGEPKPLLADAGRAIRGVIERELASSPVASSHPVQWLCFRPSDGRCFGTLQDPQLNANRDRFVICRSDQVPSWRWLGGIRIGPDGVVSYEVEAEVAS
jgi:hypothetical protein